MNYTRQISDFPRPPPLPQCTIVNTLIPCRLEPELVCLEFRFIAQVEALHG
jgi:hypothetical protein